ncbi:hypothetical protein [Natrinema sp. CBA1119]|uniref:hypothetical protein n=1 Tax=Natrinema sp. CBA1119 TaxID=1608465 RepID=UPI0011458010|nr:hypothetical protein [Natrinema sp. CBA1119]
MENDQYLSVFFNWETGKDILKDSMTPVPQFLGPLVILNKTHLFQLWQMNMMERDFDLGRGTPRVIPYLLGFSTSKVFYKVINGRCSVATVHEKPQDFTSLMVGDCFKNHRL